MLGAVAEILKARGSEAWLVGGSVRDRMLGRHSPDLDVVVSDDASAVARQVAAALHAPCFALSERYPTYRVLGSDGHVDVAAVRGDSILTDLAQRDFTVNAMAVPVAAVAALGSGSKGPGYPKATSCSTLSAALCTWRGGALWLSRTASSLTTPCA
jgi:hypothetical protein